MCYIGVVGCGRRSPPVGTRSCSPWIEIQH
nr:MAG TPA: Prokaryotic lipoprotein-attachment site [Caudoviricetes sp.]